MSNNQIQYRWPADLLPAQPFHALSAAWEDIGLSDVKHEIPIWLSICVSHECANYHDHDERARVAIFMYDILDLLEALYFALRFKMERCKNPATELDSFQRKLYNCREGFSNLYMGGYDPSGIISAFSEKYRRVYVRHELWQFFDGVRFYDGPLLKKINIFNTHNLWLLLHCTADSAYIVTSTPYIDLDGNQINVATPPNILGLK